MPEPTVKKKPRSRTKSGKWRKKRSDAGKPRKKQTIATLRDFELEKRRMRETDIPYVSEDCENCIPVTWCWANNERGFCGGIVKQPKPECDVVRFCLVGKKTCDFIDVTVSEAFDIASVFATVACLPIHKDEETK